MIKEDLQFLVFVVEIVYPQYNAYSFIVYMILNYCGILKQQQTFTLRPVSTIYLKQLIGSECIWDVHNTIVVNDKSNQSAIKYVLSKTGSSGNILRRKVHVLTKYFTHESVALTSSVLLHNFQGVTSCTFRNCDAKTLKFAEEVELSLINTSNEWTDLIIENCLKNYFKTPKLLYNGDIIVVNLKDYGKELFYCTTKLNKMNENLCFKCNKVIYMGKSVDGDYLCTVGKSTLRQTANIQSYLPKDYHEAEKNQSSSQHPFETHFENIKKTVTPFVNKDSRHFYPIFLLAGHKGSGKSFLLQSVASSLGLHLYTVNSCDVTANVYAQNETKLRNIFFTARMVAPSILEIKNFENFGKNNDGEYDERLITHFTAEVRNLFMCNVFPLLVFCSSNDRNIPIELKRIFLKIFEIRAPNQQERENILHWILTNNNIKTTLDTHALSNKSHGFIFEDLKAVVYRALSEFYRENSHVELVPESYFLEALNFMQSIYNEGLGAPKVPEVKWLDVGGLNDVKDEIIKTIKLPLKHPNILQSGGLKRSGILLFGPPGTGKTLLAKAVATECDLCFLSVKGPELLNMYVGQSEKNVREVFERARDASPCIIFFDELDSLAPNRGAAGDSGGVMDRIVSQLLAEMDGLNRTGTVFIIGATNRPDLIDPALLRPGRFDKLLYVGPCVDPVSKLAVLEALTRKFHLEEKSVLKEIVNMCSQGFSGADFYGMCSTAWMFAVRRLITNIENEQTRVSRTSKKELTNEKVVVTLDDFKTAMKHIKPSITQVDLDYFYKLKSEMDIVT